MSNCKFVIFDSQIKFAIFVLYLVFKGIFYLNIVERYPKNKRQLTALKNDSWNTENLNNKCD